MRKRRFTTWLVLAFFLMSVSCLVTPVTPALADQATLESIADEMARVYQYYDEGEKAEVRKARSALETRAADPTNDAWTPIVTPLLTGEVNNRLGPNARNTVVGFLSGVGQLRYSADRNEVLNNMTTFNNQYRDDFRLLFGNDFTMAQYYQFLLDARNQMRTVIGPGSPEVTKLAFGTPQQLVDAIPSVLNQAMQKSLDTNYTQFRGQLVAIGWSVNDLVTQEKLLADTVDSTYAGQVALAMGLVRSETQVETPVIYVGQNYYPNDQAAFPLKVKILGRQVHGLVGWYSSNPGIVEVSQESGTSGTGNYILTGKSAGTASMTVFRDVTGDQRSEAEKATTDWLARFPVTVQTSGGGGGGGGGDTTPPASEPAPSTNLTSANTTVISSNAISKQTTTTAGKTVETFTVKEEAKTEISKAKSDDKSYVEFKLPASESATTQVNISNDVLQSASGLGLAISTPNATLEIPQALVDAFAQAGQDLNITIERGTVSTSQMAGVTGAEGATVLGTPTQINTTIKGSTTVNLPLKGIDIPKDPAAKEAFLNSLAIFAQHSDGSKQVYQPTVIYDNDGNPIALNFTVDKFSVFAIIKKPAVTPPGALTDIAGHWAEANIKALVTSGAISGYPDKTFKPERTITRAEFATVMVKAFKLEAKAGKVFDDTANHWAKSSIATANAHGIISGYNDKQFGPDDLITREQMAVMIAKAAKLTDTNGTGTFTDEAEVSAWAKDAVQACTAAGILTGYPDGTFKPQGKATRAQAATVIVQAIK